MSGDPSVDTDIFAVGFEEIVDLTAKNITNARFVCIILCIYDLSLS